MAVACIRLIYLYFYIYNFRLSPAISDSNTQELLKIVTSYYLVKAVDTTSNIYSALESITLEFQVGL